MPIEKVRSPAGMEDKLGGGEVGADLKSKKLPMFMMHLLKKLFHFYKLSYQTHLNH